MSQNTETEDKPAQPASRGKAAKVALNIINPNRRVCPKCQKTASLQNTQGPGGRISMQKCRFCDWTATRPAAKK